MDNKSGQVVKAAPGGKNLMFQLNVRMFSFIYLAALLLIIFGAVMYVEAQTIHSFGKTYPL